MLLLSCLSLQFVLFFIGVHLFVRPTAPNVVSWKRRRTSCLIEEKTFKYPISVPEIRRFPSDATEFWSEILPKEFFFIPENDNQSFGWDIVGGAVWVFLDTNFCEKHISRQYYLQKSILKVKVVWYPRIWWFSWKIQFLKNTRFKTFGHLSKTFWNDLARFSSRWVWYLRKVHSGISFFFLHSNGHSNSCLPLERDQKCGLVLTYINETL